VVDDLVRAILATEINPKPGPKGDPGRDGKDGVQGIQGERGDPGRDGRDGVDGKDGRDGLNVRGPKGDPGRDGRDGVDGKDGLPGERGPRGFQGLRGEKGDPGNDGTDGSPGATLFTGGGGGGAPDITASGSLLGRSRSLEFGAGLVGYRTGPVITIEAAPGSGSDANYVHDQQVASDLWDITHGLGKYASVTVVDSAGDVCIGEVHYLNANRLTVAFRAPFSGAAYLN
jgi:hypothetical protein